MNRKLYSLLLYLIVPIIGLYFIYRGFRDKRYFSGLSQRLGFVPSSVNSGSIHIHCASVGESIAAAPLIKRLVALYPEQPFLITSTTPTGQEQLAKLIAALGDAGTHIQCAYLPIDWAGCCKRFIRRVKPVISILIETELWPNLLHFLNQQGIPTLLANARMSQKSLSKYQKYPKLSQSIFSNISMVAAQYQSDAEHFKQLGVRDSQLLVSASIKFDVELSEPLKLEQQALKNQWTNNRPSWIAGSIHPGEFSAVLSAHKKLLQRFPDLLLIAVARHPEEFSSLKNLSQEFQLSTVCRSSGQQVQPTDQVVVIDTMGEMMLMYGVADVAFVGGSLINRGGHNPIEPALCGLPVLMGPSRFNFTDVCLRMEQSKLLINITDGDSLKNSIAELLISNKKLNNYSNYANELFAKNAGAVEQLVKIVEKLIN